MEKSRMSLFPHPKAVFTGLLTWVLAAIPAAAMDVPVQLQNGTATFSQTCTHPSGSFSPDEAVDGNFTGSPFNGWAIAATCQTPSDDTTSQTAVWETATNLRAPGLTFTMHFNHSVKHLLGRFRFSVTTDDRATFADGLDTGGDVNANWTVLTNPTVSGPAGMTFTTLADHSILAGGTIPAQGVYTVSYATAVSGVTGVRLEALEDPSLPFNGPGLQPDNGNFVLTEITLDAAAALDHFLCYKAKTTPGTEKFEPEVVTLKDQFDAEPQSVEVKKPVNLCNPADKNGEGINDPDTHLKGYKILPETAHVPQTNIKVVNQFGELFVDTIKPDRLLVPSLKDLDNPVILPDPFEPAVDHFKCYKVKVTPGTPKLPKGIQASVKDQFNEVAKLFDIKKPSRLCNPVDKNGEGIKNEAAHLMCYKAKPATKHTPVTGIHVNNQFGPEQLDTIKEEDLCVPSEKIH